MHLDTATRKTQPQRSKSAERVQTEQRRERTSFLISRSIFLRSFCSRMLWSTSNLRMWSMGSLARLTPWTSSLVRYELPGSEIECP